VAGCAALYDLLGRAADEINPAAIGELVDGPVLDGRWLPGGAAPTVALSMTATGAEVGLWHPLSGSALDPTRWNLEAAGIDVSRSPTEDHPARCVMLRVGTDARAWSSAPSARDRRVGEKTLEGVSHLVVCPRWGRWAESLVVSARDRGIPTSVVGFVPPRHVNGPWRTLIASDAQIERDDAEAIDADVLVITRGASGASIRIRGEWLEVPATQVRVVDPTGAGDVFAGTLLGRLEGGTALQAAARAAADAAAECCRAWGAQTSLARRRSTDGNADRLARARGALWGLACGDAYGMPASFLPRGTAEALWPSGLGSLQPAPPSSPYHAGYPAGRVTDDTEQALAITRAIRRSGENLDPQIVAEELYAWLTSVGGESSLAVGPSSRRGLQAWRQGTPVTEIGRAGTSNGAAMRIAPVGVLDGLAEPNESSSESHLLVDVLAASMVTHHPAPAIAGAAAVAAAIATGVRGGDWPSPIETGAAAARTAQRNAPWVYAPDIADRIDLATSVDANAQSDADCADRLSKIVGAGEPASEAVPTAFGFAARAQGDPRRAIALAANAEGDTDTIAAMAGAICGAWAGEEAIPAEWRARVAAVNKLDVEQWISDLVIVAERRGARVHA
jgi:ADP-ribosylglycohydrolase